MTCLILFLACIAGAARWLEGSDLPYTPNLVLNAIIGLTSALTCWLVTANPIVACVVFIVAWACVTTGRTKWELFNHQAVRGLIPALGLILLLGFGQELTGYVWHDVATLWLMACYVAAYVCYTVGYHYFSGQWEKFCRVIQGFSISISPIFM